MCPIFLFFRHFLFKTSSGTTPLFSSSSPGYPLTSGTVYTPPPRLLPRNTFSRNAFKLKKPSKYCSWKCAALSAIAAAVLLAILLAYFIGKPMFHCIPHKLVRSSVSSYQIMLHLSGSSQQIKTQQVQGCYNSFHNSAC